MKYIRLTDGTIIDVSEMDEYESEDGKGNSIFDGYGIKGEHGLSTYYPAEDIFLQGNTLPEVCDFLKVTYRVPDFSLRMLFLDRLGGKDNRLDHCKKVLAKDQMYIISLCVLADKGIIDVARMNRKGEWELL